MHIIPLFMRPGQISSLIIVVATFKGFPIFEAMLAFDWNRGAAPVSVNMPLADVPGIVTGFGKELAHRFRVRIHGDVIDNDSVMMRILAG